MVTFAITPVAHWVTFARMQDIHTTIFCRARSSSQSKTPETRIACYFGCAIYYSHTRSKSFHFLRCVAPFSNIMLKYYVIQWFS